MSRRGFGTHAKWMRLIGFIGLLCTFWVPALYAGASSIEVAGCGQILTREFDEAHQTHDYKVMMDPGGTINIRIVPVGSTLELRAAVQEPAGQTIVESDYEKEVRFSTGKLSGRGNHTIRVRNSEYRGGGGDSRVGVYTLEISCILNDGTKVDAGSQAGGVVATPPQAAPQPVQGGGAGAAVDGLNNLGKYAGEVQKITSTVGAAQQAIQMISGVANLAKGLFGGKKKAQEASAAAAPVYQGPQDTMPKGQQLAYAQPIEVPAAPAPQPAAPVAQPAPPPVDRQTFPLIGLGTLLQGEMSISTGAQGCRFQAKAGQKIDLKFERLTGTQGLMITVFGPDQQPVFLTSVLASPSVATTLQLPAAGEYSVEVAAVGSAGSAARFSLQLSAVSK